MNGNKKVSIRPHEPLYKQAAAAGMFQVMFPYYTMSNPMLKYLPVHYGEMWALYKEGYFEVAYYEKELERVADAVLAECRDGLPAAWQKRWEEIKLELTEASRMLVGADMAALSIEELQALYERIYELDIDMWSLSIFIDAFDPGFDRKEMERIAALHGFTEEEITILVTPTEPSYVTAWELALEKLSHGTRTREELVRGFFWYGVSYSDVQEVNDAFIDAELAKRHPVAFTSAHAEEQEILAHHGLSENPLALFRTLSVWRDDRKYLNYVGLYGLVKIQRELARRMKVDARYMNAVLPHQIPDLLAGTLSASDIEQQWKGGIFTHLKPDGDFEYSLGEEAQEDWAVISEAIQAANREQEGTDLKGTIASKGIARGPVRVLLDFNDSRASDFKQGDILVTSMTRPEFLPLMKLSGAIVTDEGGITSHAAIVSRELKKPCVIGTKSASQLFKDGDMVEVDANAGIVRKLKQTP